MNPQRFYVQDLVTDDQIGFRLHVVRHKGKVITVVRANVVEKVDPIRTAFVAKCYEFSLSGVGFQSFREELTDDFFR